MKPFFLRTYFRCYRWYALSTAVLLAMLLVTIGAPARADGASAKATLYDASGSVVGKVKLVQKSDVVDAVEVRVKVNNLPPGFHGFHMHAAGACSPTFASALGHYNPSGLTHPAHAGDMPVLLVNADGTGNARFTTDRFTVDGLFDLDGSAVIVHASPDNYANVTKYASPDAATLATGDAGGRIACGVLERGDSD